MLSAHRPGTLGHLHAANGGHLPSLRAHRRCRSSRSSSRVAAGNEPSISVTFLQEGGSPVTLDVPSGEQLRAAMVENKVDVYTAWGKIWSCGGAGQCGTCIVQVEKGSNLLSERTATEDKKLNKKPANWRLACQTIVGDGSNHGSVTISTKPQAKK